jgi:hypothetical protein
MEREYKMMRWVKLNPLERLLVVRPVNRYRLAGPGWICLTLRQQGLAKIYIGPKGQSLKFTEVRTSDNIPLALTIQVIYRADPDLFTPDLLPKLPVLNETGWQGALQWQTEYVLRMLVAHYPWRELSREEIQQRLERQLTHTLADRLKGIGLTVIAGCLVKTELPVQLQQSLIQAEEDVVEAQGRVAVLKRYLEIFGANLPQAMPYIMQWELLNTIHRNNPQILLTPAALADKAVLSDPNLLQPVYQLRLPVKSD